MSQSEAENFLSAFAAVAAARPPASQSVTPHQRHARKIRPLKLQSEQSDKNPSPAAAFVNARTEPNTSSPFLRQLPPQQRSQAEHNVNDPFLRPLPRSETPSDGPLSRQTPPKPKRRPRRFVPLDQFQPPPPKPDVRSATPVKQAQQSVSPLATDSCEKGQLLSEQELRERVTQHVSHLRTISCYPGNFFRAVKTLLSCHRAVSNGELVSLWPSCDPSQAAVYCDEVLRQTIPLFAGYPAPVINAFREAFSNVGFPAPESSFPAATGVWTPCLAGSSASLRAFDAEPESVSRRLQGNLETMWDQILRLQRMYRGDISSCRPGTLDVNVALRAMAMLHPANMDVFAARLLKLVSNTGLHSQDTPVRMRQLGERLRDAPPRRHGQKGPGVVLHRLPELVRSMFEDDPGQLFFLDFLTGVDSAKLNTALIPRLVAAVAKALEAAASATTNVAFTDAVLEARINAKLLSVTMHSSNWAHSAFSLSGMDDNHVSPGLGRQALQRRVPIHSALFTASIDLEALIRDAVASEHIQPVIACVAVADVIIRLAGVDPVAKSSEWYSRALRALRSVRAVSSSGNSERMPLLRILICSLLESEACRGESPLEVPDSTFVLRCDKKEWTGIGDIRLLRVVCPLLEDLRKSIHMPDTSTKGAARRITPKAAPNGFPNATSTLLGKDMVEEKVREGKGNVEVDDVQASLRREFYARMDGRLRELVRVVVSSRPANGTAAKENYIKIVEMLYPDTAKTVAAVAANLCEYEVGLVERELRIGDKGRSGNQTVTVVKQREVDKAGEGIKEMKV